VSSSLSSSCPAIEGKGDRPSAERSDGGRGAGRDETLSTKAKRRVRRPLHHASRGPPPPLSRGRTTQLPVLALRFLFAPRALPTVSRNGPPQEGGGAPKGAYCETTPRYRSVAAGRVRGARRFWRTRSPSGALPRLSPETSRPKAQSGPALHGSANGCDSVRHPGSELLADRRRGRPGGFPNRPRMELRTPSQAPLPPASIGRHRLTSLKTSEMESFSSAGGVDSRNSGGARYLVDMTGIFFRCLFDSQALKLWHCRHDSHLPN
jgi:hypothetical protein